MPITTSQRKDYPDCIVTSQNSNSNRSTTKRKNKTAKNY